MIEDADEIWAGRFGKPIPGAVVYPIACCDCCFCWAMMKSLLLRRLNGAWRTPLLLLRFWFCIVML